MLISKATGLERWAIKNVEIHFVALDDIDVNKYSESSLI